MKLSGLRDAWGRSAERIVCVSIGCAVTVVAALLVGGPAGLTPAAAVSPDFAGAPEVLVVGDSLAVGAKPYLDALLPDRTVINSVKSGITTPDGMDRIRRALRRTDPQTVVLSLGSNDGSDPKRFADRVRRTMDLLPSDTCAIWATIIRPARKGAYRDLNRVLQQARRRDPRIVLVDWEHAVTGGLVSLRDGLHADDAGYRYRAEMIAAAVHSGCVAASATRT